MCYLIKKSHSMPLRTNKSVTTLFHMDNRSFLTVLVHRMALLNIAEANTLDIFKTKLQN